MKVDVRSVLEGYRLFMPSPPLLGFRKSVLRRSSAGRTRTGTQIGYTTFPDYFTSYIHILLRDTFPSSNLFCRDSRGFNLKRGCNKSSR